MSHLQAPSSVAAAGVKHRTRNAGAWCLAQGHAMGLNPAQPAELRILRGRVWVTMGDAVPPSGPAASQTGSVVALVFRYSVSQAMIAMFMPSVEMPQPPNMRRATQGPTPQSSSQACSAKGSTGLTMAPS